MDLLTIFLIAVALAMDAFSVSITKGFTIKNITKQETIWFGIFFGGFQALMPVLGWVAGIQLQNFVSTVAPWIAFGLLIFIGAKMIYESLSEEENKSNSFSFKELTLLAIATSIDAFAVGITFAILKTPILIPILMIGLVSFVLSIFGIEIGKKLGNFFGDKFEIVGGVVLILIGIKILFEGLGFL